MQKRQIILSSLIIAALVMGLGVFFLTNNLGSTQAQDGEEFTYAGQVAAPPFPSSVDWLNVSQPLDWEALQGKIVILDFWTYGCINCIHIIPDLEQLEEEFADSLVVIGVHSAKFANEGETQNIQQVVQRYGVTHPVVNDSDFIVWQTYGVQAWPTLVLVDPRGNVVGGRSGEQVYEFFQPILTVMEEEYSAAGLIDDTPLASLAPEVSPRDEVVLNYPGKVLADSDGNRLIISDTSNHRVVVTSLDSYDNTQVIGSGKRGFADGTFETAEFNSPQGLAIDGDTLYVADTVNHAIRQVNLADGTVSTLVGTGEQANTYPPTAGTAPDVALSSPWDLTLHNDILYIAMAGPHQLWRVDLATGETVPHAGSGLENIIDGALQSAQLAQPSGIATDGDILYFADAESSSIRTASFDPGGEVGTIVGTGLFAFGDVDGTGDEVRLQHALGVTVGPDGLLYIADTYNNKIKVINPETRSSETFAGTTDAGLADGDLADARFYEPGGLDYADGKLYIADTNNHVVRVIDLESGEVSTVEFADKIVLLVENESSSNATLAAPPVSFDFNASGDNMVEFETMTVAPGEGELIFDIQLPEGYKLNESAPFTVISTSDDTITIGEDYVDYREILPELPLHLPVTFNEGDTEFNTDLTIYWCEAVNYTLCFVERVSFSAPVVVDSNADSNSLLFAFDLVPPDLD